MIKAYTGGFIALICLTVLTSCKAYPQSNKCDTVYQVVDVMPTYKSTYQDLSNDFYKLRTNPDCKLEELQQVIWVIDKEGKISSVEVVGTLNETCKKYVMDYAKTLTEWKPGKHKGKPVCVKVVLATHIRPTK